MALTTVRIPLAAGRGFALVDADQAERVSRFSWYALSCNDGKNVYAYAHVRRDSGAGRGVTTSRVLMHKLLTGFDLTDHINGDGLDNRLVNLRAATHSQNHGNQRKRRGSSQFKGVMWDKKWKKWKAQIGIEGKSRCIGAFTDETEAALAYDERARVQFGDFAALNFPRPGERSALEASPHGIPRQRVTA